MGEFWFGRDYTVYDISGRLMENVRMFSQSAQTQAVWDYVGVPKERPDLDETARKVLRNA